MPQTEYNSHLKEIQEKLSSVPSQPGCYLWLGDSIQTPGEQRILYVGKSVNLRSRLRQYLTSDDYKTKFLMQLVTGFDWVVTGNETEALILENTLIKKHNPPYNIRLKDDKTYPWISLTLSEKYPRLILTRRKTSPENLYFGPYSDVGAAKATMELVQKIFPMRRKPQKLPLKKPARPCLNFHIGKCLAPCAEKISEDEYMKMVYQVKDFLEGKDDSVQQSLHRQMEEFASSREYEKAARVRDTLHAIQQIHEEQRVENANETENYDIIGAYVTTRREMSRALSLKEHVLNAFATEEIPHMGQIVLLKIRKGKLVGKQSYAMTEGGIWDNETNPAAAFLESFFRDYYFQVRDIPESIYLSHNILSAKTWIEGFRSSGISTKMYLPGESDWEEKQALVEMAGNNAELSLRERVLNDKLRNQKTGLRQIQKFINLKSIPETIECYDISNFHGQQAVASGVMLRDGFPYKQGYRRYRIKTIEGANDPAMMHEVLSRRFARIASGQIKQPDLIVIDGGITQLTAALRAREEQGLSTPMIGLAKQEEEIYTEDGRILSFDKNSPGMLILRLARDEAHRFGVSYHRNLRLKKELSSILDGIPGVGEERKARIAGVLRKLDLPSLETEELIDILREQAEVPPLVARRITERIGSVEG